jgi:hypothetical protein
MIGYKVKFLKDGYEAVMGSATRYVEETSVELKERCVTIKQNGAYVATST